MPQKGIRAASKHWAALCAGAALLVLGSSVSAAQPISSDPKLVAASGPLEIRAPQDVLLGTTNTVEISMRDTGEPVAMFASVGSLSSPVASQGRLTMTYTLPSTRFPQAALIAAANDDRSIIDFVSIRLHGQPTIAIESEPRAKVYVDVAGTKFGPIEVDRKGKGAIPISVPPGLDSATIVSSDRHGNETSELRKLGVPPFQQLLAVCPQGGHELIVIASNSSGAPEPNAVISLAASIGTLTAASMRSPGVYSARFHVAEGATFATSAQLTASLPAAGRASTAQCSAEIPREAPTGLEVTLGQNAFVAGSGSAVVITLDLAYPGKRLPMQAVPTVTSDVGTLSNLEAVTSTQYRARWTLPDQFENRSTAVVTARIASENLDGAATIALEAGDIARIEVNSDSERVRADNKHSATISARAFDSFGNSAAAELLTIAADAGDVGVATRDGTGITTRYVAPRRTTPGRDNVTVRAPSGQQQSISLLLLPAPSRFLANARMGFATNFGRVSTMAGAADASVRLDVAGHDLAIGLETGYARYSESQPRVDQVETVDLRLTLVPILARAVYERHDLPVQLYGGGGAGVLIASGTVESERSSMRTESAAGALLSAVVGARRRLGPGLVGIEAAYWYSRFEQTGFSGNLGGLRILGGYGFELQ